MRSQAFPLLEILLKDPESIVRGVAIKSLGDIGKIEPAMALQALPLLVSFLKEEDGFLILWGRAFQCPNSLWGGGARRQQAPPHVRDQF